jgi:molybdopterin-containing oxidoreductase family iron-sulfur binding subunit
MDQGTQKKSRYGMLIDLDRCNGCGACMVACAVEHNVAPAEHKATSRTGVTWLRVAPMSNGGEFPETDTVYVPMPCQQCEKDTPCVAVCPQNAVDVDPTTGIVGQVPQRCLGCRYCMTACPYHARYFDWWDPQWPKGMEQALNPDVAPRMRGVVEKCNFCHGRLHAARTKAAAEGRESINPADYVPACVEVCPAKAIVFGDLEDATSEVAQAVKHPHAFRFLEKLGTESKVYYRSDKQWVLDKAKSLQTV